MFSLLAMISLLQIQMTQARSLSVYLVLGEESGDALAVDAHLARAILEHLGKDGCHLAPLFHPGLRHWERAQRA